MANNRSSPSSVVIWWVVAIAISSVLFFVPLIYLIATIPHLIAICNSLFAFVVLSLVGFFLILAVWVGIMIRDMNKNVVNKTTKRSVLEEEVDEGRLNDYQRTFGNQARLLNGGGDDEMSGEEYDDDDEESLIQQQQGNNELVMEESNRAANLIEETRRNQQYKQTTEYIVQFLRVGSFLIFIVLLIGLLLFSIWIGTTKSRAEGLLRGSMSINEIVTRANAGDVSYKEAQPYIQKFLEQLGQSTVKVERDSNDVIHITAPNEYTLYFTQGFVHAQERLWQIDTLKSTIKGELSSLFGYGLIFSDQYYLTMGLYEAAQRDWANLGDDLKQRLEAYAYGLNTYAKLLPGLPVEFQLLSYKPGVFTGVDILAHHKYISLTLAGNIHSEIARYGLELVGLSYDRIKTILPNSYPNGFPIISSPNANITYQPSSTTSSTTSRSSSSSTRKKSLSASISVLAGQIISGLEDLVDIFSSSSTIRQRFALSMFDPQNHFSSPEQKNAFLQASNNWVIGGAYTSTGKPLHANDIHLHFQGPNIFLLMHLKIESSTKPMQVIGASIAGLPCVIVGRNGNGISWSITNAGADTMDTYLIDENADGLTYNYGGAKNSYTIKTVTLSVKGGSKAMFNVTTAGSFGPLVDKLYNIPNLPKQKRLALRYLDVLLKTDKSTQTFFDLPYTTNYDQFIEAFKNLNAPVLNILYADNNNNIGYIMAGKLPKRGSTTTDNLGLRPVKTYDSTEKSYTWETDDSGNYKTNAFDDLPDIAPEVATSRFIFSANNKAEANPVTTITNDYSLLYGRSMRIQSLVSSLIARKNITLSDMAKVQSDSVSVLYLMNRNIFARMKPFTDTYKEGVRNDLANNWDGDMKPDSKYATIFEYWMTYLTNLAANETKQDNDLPFSKKKSFPLSLRYALSAIQTELSTGVTDQNCKSFSSDKTCLGYAKDQLEAVLVALRSKFSFVPLYSSYRIHQTKFTHPIFGAYGLTGCLGTRISRKSGGTDTINEGGPSDANLSNNFGPTYRQIIDHANPESSVFIMPMGQSGNIFSDTYDNYLQAWEDGKYIPMKTKDYIVRDVLIIAK
ncbi:penicillin amidase domain-containing protein [Naegleria gruberi]|uniref:Penicillin amidase domain-containing protein n=1 Tax=Naegleria gruberi TaxID=5762 RepID=D2VR61_NAEGR|nr:penicillin amidase domain-containing protein [Naegleria gruberi]EFC40747.1 penicillin amidase domain-containing protein [Naegleria gruberi]|eukprot:XP_002673491.1 penicillin amidase domain-containing protein [Naegleria gruberi strain NEG-M]